MVEGVTNTLKARILSLIMTCACCCTVEGTRGDANLAIDNSMELYVVMGMAAVTLLVIWEGLYWMWVRIHTWSWNVQVESRHAKKLRRLQEAVGDEIHQQLTERAAPVRASPSVYETVDAGTPAHGRPSAHEAAEAVTPFRERASMPMLADPPPTRTLQRSSSSSPPRESTSTAIARGSAAIGRHHRDALIATQDAAVQASGQHFEYSPPEPAVARLEIREVFPEEYYMTQHGAHVHVHRAGASAMPATW